MYPKRSRIRHLVQLSRSGRQRRSCSSEVSPERVFAMVSIADFLNFYALCACILCVLWYYSTWTFDYWKKRNVKFKKPIPFFGNTGKFMILYEPMHSIMHDIYTYLGDEPYGGIFQLQKPVLFVKDPEMVNDVLIKDFKHFYDHDVKTFVNFNKELNPLNGHLFSSEGERWRVLRQKMSPIFTSGKLKFMHEQIYDCVRAFEQCIASKTDGDAVELEMKEVCQNLTVDVIGSCAFGLTCNATSSGYTKFREMGEEIFKFRIRDAVRLVISTINQKILNLIKFPDIKKEVQDFYLNMVLDTMAYRRSRGEVRNDALQLLMNLQNTHRDEKYALSDGRETILKNEEFDEVDVAANAFLFFVGGFETTASTLSYCFYELAVNPEVQNKLRQEIERVQDEHPKQTPESLKELTYMDMVIKETLRKYPPLSVLNRVCTADYILPRTKTLIPAGIGVAIPVWSIQHDPKYYPNPEVFDPDRFDPENDEKRPNGTYIPFGDGPRLCLGKRFAEMEMKSALAELIPKYDFSPCSKTEIPLTYKPSFFVVPKNGIFIRITKREGRTTT